MRHVLALIILALFVGVSRTEAAPTSPVQAGAAVRAWLAADGPAFGASGEYAVSEVIAFEDDQGEFAYYVVQCYPDGFAVVPDDDMIEPILAFVAHGTYDEAGASPLDDLIRSDLAVRFELARMTLESPAKVSLDASVMRRLFDAQSRWRSLLKTSGAPIKEGVSVSDMRVPPLIRSVWGQDAVPDARNKACFNYYTPSGPDGSPDNYPTGCTATAMAQLMFHDRCPSIAVGTAQFSIRICGREEVRALRGGNGRGGRYDWDDMRDQPDRATTEEQCEAMGALTHDAGVTVESEYSSECTISHSSKVGPALTQVFDYTNTILGYSDGHDLGSVLNRMINPNLDAGRPVLLALQAIQGGSHTVLCDGYGYSGETLYHHLNIGWWGTGNAWYNLPAVDLPAMSTHYSAIPCCWYNIFPDVGSWNGVTGEIISGRVLDLAGLPVQDACVTATAPSGRALDPVYTNDAGIYTFVGVDPTTRYAVRVENASLTFKAKEVTTGFSQTGTTQCGNVLAADFGASACADPPDPPNNVKASIGTYPDKVAITWDLISDTNVEYQVLRLKMGSTGTYQVVCDWTKDDRYEDTSAEPPRTGTVGGGGCGGAGQAATEYQIYFYQVKARNGAGCESSPSKSVQGYAGTLAGKQVRAATLMPPFVNNCAADLFTLVVAATLLMSARRPA